MVVCAPDRGIYVMLIPLLLNLNPDWPCDHFPSQPWYSFQLQLPNCFLALQWSVNLQHFASFANNPSTRGVTPWLPMSLEIFILGNKIWMSSGRGYRLTQNKLEGAWEDVAVSFRSKIIPVTNLLAISLANDNHWDTHFNFFSRHVYSIKNTINM